MDNSNLKRLTLLALILASMSTTSWAQSVTDVVRYSNSDLVGTARYMSMGGAFNALGGDITTLSQNPAGIGVYRSSEVAATVSLGGVKASSINGFTGGNLNYNKFNGGVNNFGYVGTFMTGKSRGLISFNVGFAYNRQAGERRNYGVAQAGLQSALSDYIADRTNVWGGNPDDLIIPENVNDYDPYYDSGAPWLSILAYNSYAINNTGNGYDGLYAGQNVAADGELVVEEKSRIDEYTFNVGGNISNKVYWGLALGIMDLSFDQRIYYDEYYYNNQELGSLRLDNILNTSGTGVNLKAGIIVKPTSFLRLGVAVHTPTWYKISEDFGANMRTFGVPGEPGEIVDRDIFAPSDFYQYKLRTPWKYHFGAAAVIGRKAILSVDYNLENYSTSRLRDTSGSDRVFEATNFDLQNQLTMKNTVKVGLEYRVTRMFSMRLGYANQMGIYTDMVKDNRSEIFPIGTVPNYALDKGSQFYTGGLGYRFGNFFADAAFVWKNNYQDVYLMPTVPDGAGGNFVSSSPTEVKTSSFRIVITGGYKF